MVNTKIKLIIFFAAEDGEALYSQPKTKLAVAQSAKFRHKWKKVGKTTSSLLKNLGLNGKK